VLDEFALHQVTNYVARTQPVQGSIPNRHIFVGEALIVLRELVDVVRDEAFGP